jgi:hypothetical protein
VDPLVALEQELLPHEDYSTFLSHVEKYEKVSDLLPITSSCDQIRAVQILTERYKTMMSRHRNVFNTGDAEKDARILGHCVEKYLFEATNLYEHVLIESKSDRRTNEEVFARLQAFNSILKPQHLGLPDEMEQDEIWNESVKLMRGINHFRTLFGKLGCMQASMKGIFQMKCFRREDLCTDLFLSAVIFLLARANPRNLHSNVNFVSKYGLESELYAHCQINETGFMFTNFQCAYMFWKDLNLREMDQMFQELGNDRKKEVNNNLQVWRHARRPSLANSVDLDSGLGKCIISNYWNYMSDKKSSY